MSGFSFYISFGKNKGFKLLEKDGPSIRTSLWIVSICFTLTDIEGVLRNLLSELREKDSYGLNHDEVCERERNLNSQVESFEKRIKALKNKMSELRAENDRLDKEEVSLNDTIEKTTSRIDDLEMEVQDLTDSLDEVNIENEEFQSKLIETEKKLKRTEQHLVNMEFFFCFREDDL